MRIGLIGASLLLFLKTGSAQEKLFPPDGCILLTERTSTVLSWPGGASNYRLEVMRDGKHLFKYDLSDSSIAIPIQAGANYSWTVTPKKGATLTARFSVAQDWQYHADGLEGSGNSGGDIAVQLERLPQGMRMKLDAGRDHRVYLFDAPGRRFLLSSRGGRGGMATSYEFLDFGGEDARDPYPAGPGGWGGRIVISTRDAPWRDYLEVDVSPGRGGSGAWANVNDGPPGQPGKVITKILP